MGRVYNDNTGNYDWVPDEQQFDYGGPPQGGPQLGSFGVPINSNQPVGTQDLSYWQSRHDEGLPGAPGVDEMFDENGQLKPGWKRTAKGYEMVPQGAATPPTTYGDGNTVPMTTASRQTGGGGFSYGGGPQANFSPYLSAGEFAPRRATFDFQPFAYDAFKGSNWNDAENEPGFQQSQDRLRKMVENSAAYRGVLRSGQTIGNLDSVLDTNKGQNFQQFDARNFRNYSANRDNAFGAWQGNLNASRNKFLDEYGIDKDVYGFHAQDVDRNNNYNFNTQSADLNNELAKWTSMVNSLTSLGRPV